MATPIKQIQTSDEVLHDIQGAEYIVGTQSAATNMWKGVSGSAELYAGKVINYKLPYAGATNTNTHTGLTTNTTLELTLADGSTVVYPVYRNASTAITTHYPVNSIVRLIFDPTEVTLNGHTFEGSWKTADYDSNTNTYVTQSNTTTNSFLPLIIKAATATATVTTTVRFNSKLTGNPSSGAIKLNTTSITPTASSAITLSLPNTGGTLALTSDIPSSLPPTAHTHAWGDITNPPTSYTPTAHTHTIGQVYNGTSALSVNSSSSNIQMDGTASAGSGSALALANHVHPTDTSRAPINSPAFTGYPTLANAPSTIMGVANKGYVDSALGGITQVDYTVTTTLPTTGVKGTIYLVSHEHDADQNDYYDEYIYANNTWEKIGHTDVDLSQYIKIIDLGDIGAIPTFNTSVPTIDADIKTEIMDAIGNNKNFILKYSGTINNKAVKGYLFPENVLIIEDTLFQVFEGDTQYVTTDPTWPNIFKVFFGINNYTQLIGAFKYVDGFDVESYMDDVPQYQEHANWAEEDSSNAGYIENKPTIVSYFTNDAGYITSSDIPSNVSSFNNDVGYLTASAIPSITAAASLTTGVTIGSIDIDGNTTTFYAPELTANAITTALGYTPSTQGHSHAWADITNPPASYTPSSHTHDYSKVSVTTNASGPIAGTITIDSTSTTLKVNTTTSLADGRLYPVIGIGTASENEPLIKPSKIKFSEISGAGGKLTITGISDTIEANLNATRLQFVQSSYLASVYPPSTLTGSRVYYLQDKSGTIALVGDAPAAHTHTLGDIYSGNTSLSTTTLAGVSGSTTASKATAGTAVELYQASVSNNVLNLTAYTLTPYTFADVTVPKATTSITVVKV